MAPADEVRQLPIDMFWNSIPVRPAFPSISAQERRWQLVTQTRRSGNWLYPRIAKDYKVIMPKGQTSDDAQSELSVVALSACLTKRTNGSLTFNRAALDAFGKRAFALTRGADLFEVIRMMLRFGVVLRNRQDGSAALASLQKAVMPLIAQLEKIAAHEGPEMKARASMVKRIAVAQGDFMVPAGMRQALAPRSGGVGLKNPKERPPRTNR